MKGLSSTSPDIEVNLADIHGITALMATAGNGHDCVVRMLLEVPKINTGLASPGDGHTAVPAALANRHDAVTRLLQVLEGKASHSHGRQTLRASRWKEWLLDAL